ncbi:MAG TPA: cytochrome c oxidase subunit 3 [Planctomycetota bacterium]|nr:cytochrome c oxidase subunit 3 [Planctomycetota bacterium]
MDTLAATLPVRKPKFFTNGKLAMWLFLGSDAMGFMGLIGAYIVLRITSPNWEDPKFDPPFGINLTAFMTFLLIVSSVTMVTALHKIGHGDRKGLLFWLGMTILGGLGFLCLQAYEWTHFLHGIHERAVEYTAETGKIAPFTNYQATFFSLTGFHGLHVSIGVVYMSCIWIRAWQGAYTEKSHSPVELVGLYWHFVDLVWIVLFTIIYLLPDSVVN